MTAQSEKEFRLRLDNMERLVREIHAKVVLGADAPLKTDDPIFRIIAREMLNGNTAPQKALRGRRMEGDA